MSMYNLPSIFKKITDIEKSYDVDRIIIKDGTKIWNLIRVILYFYTQQEKINQKNNKISISLIKESIKPISVPKNVKIFAFSSTESRRYRENRFYDIYFDPLYDIFGERLGIFEWPSPSGERQKYNKNVYSKNYIAMYIPLFSKTFLNVAFVNFFKDASKDIILSGKNILEEIITKYSHELNLDTKKLRHEVKTAISTFYYLKKFFKNFLMSYIPYAVLIKCGYGRFHMALSQACRELDIPSIELQHGIITRYHAGYVKITNSDNRDGVPEYLLTYGDVFSGIVKKGSLFEKDKVVSVGFPYLEEIRKSSPILNDKIKKFVDKFSVIIFVTSQWIVGDEIKKFVINLAKKINSNVGIILKPHPRDWRNYDDIKKYKNIFVANKYDDTYEIFKVIDVHSTAYSTSGLEALAFGKPNIFINVGKTSIEDIIHVVDNNSSFMVSSPDEYIKIFEKLIKNYDDAASKAIKAAEKFFKSNAKKNIKKFFNSLSII